MSHYDYKNIASDYDNMVQQYNWRAPKLMYYHLSNYAKKDDKLLDVGVGTGISSERFYEKGVLLYGIDTSPEMIAVCESKEVFKEVRMVDITKEAIPYPDLFFDVVVCSGVFNFFSEPKFLFKKTNRVLKHEGYFAFTIFENAINDNPVTSKVNNGLEVFYHHINYIESLGKEFEFSISTEIPFETLKNLNSKETITNRLIIMKKG